MSKLMKTASRTRPTMGRSLASAASGRNRYAGQPTERPGRLAWTPLSLIANFLADWPRGHGSSARVSAT